MKRQILISMALMMCLTMVKAQELNLVWKFQTGDRILASPIADNGTIYVGSEDRTFYAIDEKSGAEKWKFKTPDRILSTASIFENVIMFEAGNVYYALDKHTGKALWQFDPGYPLWGYKIDPYDDKRSKAVIHDGVFYIGSSIGVLYGFDAKTGAKVFSINADYNMPIRTTPVIHNNILYFGDWAGQLYAYNLAEKKAVWKKKTYESKPYDTFGGIASEILIHDDKLYFGARNPELQVMNPKTGELIWSFKDSTGGWIIGDPVILQNTLYIGGSDNHKMFAFDANSGSPKWTYDSQLNIYTKPIVNKDFVAFTAGNAYNPKSPGKVMVVKTADGSLISEFEIPMASFSSPALSKNSLYFGCYDGALYKLSLSN